MKCWAPAARAFGKAAEHLRFNESGEGATTLADRIQRIVAGAHPILSTLLDEVNVQGADAD
ncbi:MAG: hypothetical protein ABIP64_12430 [Burkholderiales bacterium]